eukprot:1196364-Prorocentrum_minimum.AAC.4
MGTFVYIRCTLSNTRLLAPTTSTNRQVRAIDTSCRNPVSRLRSAWRMVESAMGPCSKVPKTAVAVCSYTISLLFQLEITLGIHQAGCPPHHPHGCAETMSPQSELPVGEGVVSLCGLAT